MGKEMGEEMIFTEFSKKSQGVKKCSRCGCKFEEGDSIMIKNTYTKFCLECAVKVIDEQNLEIPASEIPELRREIRRLTDNIKKERQKNQDNETTTPKSKVVSNAKRRS